MSAQDKLDNHAVLLAAIKKNLPELEQLWAAVSDDEWGYEDPVYRFYHQSFKVARLHERTTAIVSALQKLMPEAKLNMWFMEIIEQGTGHNFSHNDNMRWTKVYRPVLEAFFHARFMLEMAVKYGRSLDAAPEVLPSGWAALLYLYEIR